MSGWLSLDTQVISAMIAKLGAAARPSQLATPLIDRGVAFIAVER
jgi:hypothetical protein